MNQLTMGTILSISITISECRTLTERENYADNIHKVFSIASVIAISFAVQSGLGRRSYLLTPVDVSTIEKVCI